METLTLTPLALEQLGELLRDTPFIDCAILFAEVITQKPALLETSQTTNRSSMYADIDTQGL